MNYERIKDTIDVKRMNRSSVVVVGGALALSCGLARSGLKKIHFVDFDHVSDSNPARQDYSIQDINRLKIDAAIETIHRANPDTEVIGHARDICTIPQQEFDELFGDADLLINATDSFVAQARGNVESIRLGIPSLFIGLYAGGRASEIIYYVPDGPTTACHRCICSSRYQAFQNGGINKTTVSSSGTIFDMHLTDAIAGQIAAGILTRGADNRMGRLIDQLGNRNLIQVKMDPEYRLGNKDIFREYLGDSQANFSFTSICLPMEPEYQCPDCQGIR